MNEINLFEYLVNKLFINSIFHDTTTLEHLYELCEYNLDDIDEIEKRLMLKEGVLEWITTNEISRPDQVRREIFNILESHHFYRFIQDLIDPIIKEKYANDFKFYIECMEREIWTTPVHLLNKSVFENWTFKNQSIFKEKLASKIADGSISFDEIPTFFFHERSILIAVAYVYWDLEYEQQNIFKKYLRETNFTKDREFIDEIFLTDDGSLAGIIADESIKKLPEYWHKDFKAWLNSPSGGHTGPLDYKCYYECLPENFQNDLGFIKTLINQRYKFYHGLNENMKVNAEICKMVLEKDGLFLEYMPEIIKDNCDLAFIAIKQNSEAITFITDNLTYEQDFLKKAIDANPDAINYAIPRIKYLYENAK